ncbi:(2Fe-2S)-binding protein [Ensifer sp. ENS06]|uniref:(2Fe-2S)-binding protein n=1 Tax=Ensifer sp. ENS06 TaxID=2769276 RepID=UPI001785C6D2|nr:(2Fe-2S)-binding protein [Ensifer sp. ENS06]MBD9627075.1 (2Fe-2S)-binding protein [Ensifer sp. ENS06]
MVRHPVAFKINGQKREAEIDTRTLLIDLIRDTFHFGGAQRCPSIACTGACTVLVNGWPVCSCLTLAVAVNGAQIRTIEGLRCDDGTLHPLQQALVDHCSSQCEYCTAGILMSATALLDTNPRPTREDIRRSLAGNICHCTGYANIIDAVLAAAKTMRATLEAR